MKFSKYHLSTDELSDVEMPNKRIIFSTRTATSILIEENIYQLAINNEFDKIDKETGKVRKREDGKVLKPVGWVAPNLEPFVTKE